MSVYIAWGLAHMLITPHAPPFKAMQWRARVLPMNGAATSSVRAAKVNQVLKDYSHIFACGTLPSVINDPLNTQMEEMVFWPGDT